MAQQNEQERVTQTLPEVEGITPKMLSLIHI